MLNIKLYTYKNNKTLKHFVKNILKDNERVFLLSEVDFDFEKDLIYYIDISSIIIALKNNQNSNILFQVEQNIIKFNKENVKYMVEESLKEFIAENFVLIFDESEKICDDIVEITPEEKNDTTNVKFLKDLNEEEFNKLIYNFNDKLIGHQTFKSSFEKNLREFKLFNKIGEHKILSIFLFGPSGIGKTEVARTLHKLIAPSEKMIKINFGNYGSQGALNSLIGSPRGFIGSEDGELNIKLESSKSSIILIDEFEKADKQVTNFFLELLEEGKYTDLQGIEHNLDGYIIIFTSNISEHKITEDITPEFINRINYIGKFNFLNENDKKKYLKRRTQNLIQKFNENNNYKIPNEKIKIFDEINLSHYSSIRDIENEIKKKFIDLVGNINLKNDLEQK